jgi:NAD(P)-dependent dehydrogenase (short-subunit alcohol dehydrogenase family)
MTGALGRLAGKVALVTGGARGQGAAHARRLAEEGACVVTGDVLDAEGEATAAELRALGLRVDYVHLDVTRPKDWAAAVGVAVARFGGLDVLVNNAGIIHVNPLLEESLEDWNALLAVNVTGVMLGMQAAIPQLRARGGGSVVNISSVFGLAGASGYLAYCASKAAVVMMSKTAAIEHAAERIRVNAVCPGGVGTAMNEHEGGGVVPFTPMGRRATVREITGTVLFLASDDSTFVTGTEIVVDGGYLAR